jgi:hypothetical protein
VDRLEVRHHRERLRHLILLVQWLEGYLQDQDHNSLNLLALLVQRSRQINAHTTALDEGIQMLKIQMLKTI